MAPYGGKYHFGNYARVHLVIWPNEKSFLDGAGERNSVTTRRVSHPFSLRIRDGYRETGSSAVTVEERNKKKKSQKKNGGRTFEGVRELTRNIKRFNQLKRKRRTLDKKKKSKTKKQMLEKFSNVPASGGLSTLDSEREGSRLA
ncbi:hypothetical protein PUN28_003936 [Cardiocondyla obscurior]|uniref:Uncharacterized protein n=1 Tax=Cardiocondyla obscurior TaxID=286306 RepID=A0AAW2GNW3_9HYME